MNKYTKLVCVKCYNGINKNEIVYSLIHGIFTYVFKDINDKYRICMFTGELTTHFISLEKYRELQLNKILCY